MKIEYWFEFIDSHSLEGVEIEIPENIDQSGVGAEFEILNREGIREEMEEAYPGVIVSKDGYIPVAGCSIGTGDQYFINQNDGPNGKLYRIYHDSVGDDGYDKDQAIDIVLKDYTDMLEYK